jgi:hypothetical protein
VRKSYVLQYAPEGAQVIRDETEVPCDAPERQFLILADGHSPETTG